MTISLQTGLRPPRRVATPLVERDAYPLIEVADRVGGVSIRTVYNYFSLHSLRSVRIGGKRMVLKEDLAAFLAKFRAESL